MTEILQTLKEYIPISLEEMSGIKLMNRTDTKYVTSYQILKEILLAAGHDYRVQEVNGEYNIAYHTIYLDTADRDMYLTHRNGRVVREKIRIRTYVDSDLTFLEVKNKNNKINRYCDIKLTNRLHSSISFNLLISLCTKYIEKSMLFWYYKNK